MTFEQGLENNAKINYANIWDGRVLGRETARAKALRHLPDTNCPRPPGAGSLVGGEEKYTNYNTP